MREVYNKQSLWSKILNNLFLFTNSKKNSSSEENAKRFIEKSSRKKLNKLKFRDFENELVDGHSVYCYNGTFEKSKKKILLYVHGGNYVEHANFFQISFAKKIAKRTGSTLVLPIYELLPFGNYKKMHELLQSVYFKILESQPEEINFLGDSAGGGSLLSYAQYISNYDVLQPKNIVLLSPWIDLSMTNPSLYDDAKKDKMNDVDGTRYEGKLWADGIDTTDSIVSPIYGNFDKIKKISIIFGGSGILASECRRFDKILSDVKIDHNFIVFEKEGHDFALFPTKEGELAINKIVDIIGRG